MKKNIEKINKKFSKFIKKYFNFLDKNKTFNFMEVVCLMIITSIFGMFLGGVIMYRKGTLNLGIRKNLSEFIDTYTEILNEYYEDVDSNGLLEAGVSGMINYLGDPYSVYMDTDESNSFNEKVSGEYVGIGTEILVKEGGVVEFVGVNENGPAYKAGIKVGDILIKVDNKEVNDKNASNISSLVKGEKGTKVTITVKRDDKEIDYTVTRGVIDIESVSGKVINYKDKKIGYIGIDIFASNTAEQFDEVLTKLEKDKIDSLIIDVRSNTGGYLNVVTDIISNFLPKGEVIYQLKTKDVVEKIYDKTGDKRNYKICVLVNSGSASASEVLTAALHDSYKATVIGTTTYGKSKVQKTYGLSNGATVKYTFQEWLTPKGKSVGDKGFEPDIEVKYEKAIDENSYDSQVTKALEELVK